MPPCIARHSSQVTPVRQVAGKQAQTQEGGRAEATGCCASAMSFEAPAIVPGAHEGTRVAPNDFGPLIPPNCDRRRCLESTRILRTASGSPQDPTARPRIYPAITANPSRRAAALSRSSTHTKSRVDASCPDATSADANCRLSEARNGCIRKRRSAVRRIISDGRISCQARDKRRTLE